VDPGVAPDPDPVHADDASGGEYVEALPDTRVTHDDTLIAGENFWNTPGTGPTLTYRVYFNTPGRYYGHARAYSTGTEDNGIHLGIDGDWPSSSERMQWCSGKNQWTWSSNQRDSGGDSCGMPGTIWIDVDAAGEHLIMISAREDGFEFDKLVLSTDAEYSPEGQGPPESFRE
jgi:hypothetical protein